MPRTCCAPSLYAAHCSALCVSVCLGLGGGEGSCSERSNRVCYRHTRAHMRTHARLLSGSVCVFWRLRSGMCPESLRLRRTPNSKVHQLEKKKKKKIGTAEVIQKLLIRIYLFFPRLEYIFANKEGITDRLDFSFFFFFPADVCGILHL